MTALATILGLLPLALGFGEGNETMVPLARAVVGGLAVSTVMTLLVVPVMHAGPAGDGCAPSTRPARPRRTFDG